VKPVSATAEQESTRLFWVVQTVFGFILGRSFYDYGSSFIPPFAACICYLQPKVGNAIIAEVDVVGLVNKWKYSTDLVCKHAIDIGSNCSAPLS
jgi:hypothetical protein